MVDEVMLKYFAMAVAKSLKHPEICQTLKKKIGEKFDGDYDALWDHIKNKRISGRDLRVLVNSRFSEHTRKVLPIEKIEEIPLLQVALPVNFDNWDGESTILVAYTPLTIDDMEWKEIYAYDADLKEYILDVKTEPDYPVMVVGIIERCDKKGTPLHLDTNLMYKGKKLSKSSEVARANGSSEILEWIRILDDHDPWPSGDADAYIAFGGTNRDKNMKNYVNLGDLSTRKSGYYFYLDLFYWNTEQWGYWVGFAVIDQDGGDRDWAATITSDTQCNVRATSNDDTIGKIDNVDFYHSEHATYNYGDVRSTMDW